MKIPLGLNAIAAFLPHLPEAMYFQCSSRLVDMFRMVFDQKFQYEGNRAIVFQLNQEIPVAALKECIKATLTYHKVKHLITHWEFDLNTTE